MKPPIALDLETVGEEWTELDESVRKYLVGRQTRKLVHDPGSTAAPEVLARENLALSPGTGRIIVIGMVNVISDQSAILYEGSGGWVDTAPGATRVFRGSEREMLTQFWQLLDSFGRCVTYNGRAFDLPYLYIRSALLGLRPSRQLLANRYSINAHCDLAEVLTFFGAAQERMSLDFWCRRFGLVSPKEQGIDGSQVGAFYKAGRIDEIAEYCLRDSRATAQLYRKVEGTLLPLWG